ncbi:MAG: hypothetical protein HQ481_03765 [Alphaproteobacteria bacterium]|nr:hypothetical protein [Alphaproteobacteria bacterium]
MPPSPEPDPPVRPAERARAAWRRPWRRVHFRSAKRAFLAITIPLILGIVGLFLVLFEVDTYQSAVAALEAKRDRILQSQSVMIARAAWERDDVQITLHAASVIADPDIVGLFVYDRDGVPIGQFGSDQPEPGTGILGEQPIRYAVGAKLEPAGRLVLVMTDARVWDVLRDRIIALLVFALLLAGAIVLAAQLAFDLVIGKALARMLAVIDGTRQGAVRETVDWHGPEDIGEVVEAFNRLQHRQAAYEVALDESRVNLERRVEERTAELRAARDAAEAASRSKTAFLANMSHELRTPLNAIIGFAEVMIKQRYGPLGDERYRHYAEIVLESGTHLLDLINDLLDLSKAEAGHLTLSENAVSLATPILRACDMMRAQAEQNDIELTADIPTGTPAVRADARMMMQLLANLLSNAVKFTPAGGQVSVRAILGADNAITIEVADSGIGIPVDQLGAVMQPFTQLDTTLHRRHRGTGLGLPMCRAIVEAHSGRLTLDSRPGEGTRVRVTLPPERTVLSIQERTPRRAVGRTVD